MSMLKRVSAEFLGTFVLVLPSFFLEERSIAKF